VPNTPNLIVFMPYQSYLRQTVQKRERFVRLCLGALAR
jgi:hypothetical protein